MPDNNKNIILLLGNPQETIMLNKGRHKKVQFVVPPSMMNPELTPYAPQMFSRFGEDASEQVEVKQFENPELGDILLLEKDDDFSVFNPKHTELSTKLLTIFMKAKTSEEFLSTAVYARERVNPYLFQYAFSVAIKHRKDTSKLSLPSIATTFPDKFFHSKILGKAREQASVVPNAKRKPVEIPVNFTASNEEMEQRLFYFREDIGLNLHHWSWHLVYPFSGPTEIVKKDRRGELFYYMHLQIMARYDTERLCNGLFRTKPFYNLREPIPEAYFSKLNRSLAKRAYVGRVSNLKFKNLSRQGPTEGSPVDVDDLERWLDSIYEAINDGYVRDENMKKIVLDEFTGIDILGDIMEASDISVNKRLYGNYHNSGHRLAAFIHDPDGRHLEKGGVMGDQATAMRDPFFYRWHAHISDIFVKFKDGLPSYTEKELACNGIDIESIKVTISGQLPNILRTYWAKSSVNISDGLDFQDGGDLLVNFTHLQHVDFNYEIKVANLNKLNQQGTCRIFIAPKYDEKNRPLTLAEQRRLFIELDKFMVALKPGKSRIIRPSVLSSVTIPFDQTYRDLSKISDDREEETRYCGCGWPHNLLIPKGTPTGYACELFLMISNYDEDRVVQNISLGQCKDAFSYCGIKDKLYPDRRPMGFPFDRKPRKGINNLRDFLLPNMIVQDVKIVFSENYSVKS